MPELTSITVQSADVKVGDSLLVGSAYRRVSAVDAKVKWIYVTVDGRKGPVEVARGTEVRVERMVRSEAEKEAEKRATLLIWLDSKERGAASALASAQAKMAEKLVQGEMLSHWDLEAIAEAQGAARLWARVEMISRNVALRSVDFDPTTERWTVEALADVAGRLEIMDTVKEELREELINASHASRSTSVFSNAVEDVERDAKRAFLSRW